MNVVENEEKLEVINNFRDNPNSKDCSFQLTPWPIYYRHIHIYETDKDGVVHFSNYCRIAEEALFNGFRKFGYFYDDSDYSIAMLENTVHYVEPLKFCDSIEVCIKEFAMKRVRLLWAVDFLLQGKICAEVRFSFVMILVKLRKVIPIPETFKKKFKNCQVNIL